MYSEDVWTVSMVWPTKRKNLPFSPSFKLLLLSRVNLALGGYNATLRSRSLYHSFVHIKMHNIHATCQQSSMIQSYGNKTKSVVSPSPQFAWWFRLYYWLFVHANLIMNNLLWQFHTENDHLRVMKVIWNIKRRRYTSVSMTQCQI
jgi:hypothetical protein